MTETVEYTSANLSPEQKRWCEHYENDTDGGQVRVETFRDNGDAVVHLHRAGESPRVVVLPREGRDVQEIQT